MSSLQHLPEASHEQVADQRSYKQERLEDLFRENRDEILQKHRNFSVDKFEARSGSPAMREEVVRLWDEFCCVVSLRCDLPLSRTGASFVEC